MLTEKGDFIIDPFAGSCVTGEVAERLERRWICFDAVEEYLEGAVGRFNQENLRNNKPQDSVYYKIPRPGLLWSDEETEEPLPQDGGRERPKKRNDIIASTPSLPESAHIKEQTTEEPVIQYGFFDNQ